MFRIDSVLPRSANSPDLWVWSVKVPSGLYETLVTNEKGQGLYVRRMSRSAEGPPFHLTQLFAEDDFCIPGNTTKDQSINILGEALNKLGWDQDFIVRLKYL